MWTLTFKDIDNATITVEIEGGNGTLTGAAEPLITRELETDDPFEPVRYQTGYINLVGTDGADIRPQDTFDRPVTIKKNGAIVWLGYIAVEEWNNSMSEYPQTVQLPLISALGVLDYVEYQANSSVLRTIGEVLHKALGYSNVDWSNVYYDSEDFRYFESRLSEYAFRGKKDKDIDRYEGIAPELPERKDIYTAMDAISEVCKLLGWQMRENGADVWFVKSDTSASYQYMPYQSLRSTSSASTGSYSSIDHTINYKSNYQSRSMLAPKNQVRITVDKNPLDDDVISLDNIINRLEFNRETFSGFNGSVKAYVADLYSMDANIIEINPYRERLIPENINIRSASAMVSQGAVLCKDAYIDKPKEDFYKDTTTTNTCLTISSPLGDDVVTLHSEDFYTFSHGGFLDLQLSVSAMSYYDEEIEPQGDSVDIERVYACLGFGSQWYDGAGNWTSTKKRFVAFRTDSDSDVSNWRHNCSGKPIPLPTGHGRFTLILCKNYSGKIKYLRFSDITLTLRPAIKKSPITDYSKTLYNAVCRPNARDTYSVTHKLYFQPSTVEPLVISYGRIDLDYIYGNPITIILGRMQTWYNKSHMRLQVDSAGTDYNPVDTANNCIIGARQVNWRDNETRLTLYSK